MYKNIFVISAALCLLLWGCSGAAGDTGSPAPEASVPGLSSAAELPSPAALESPPAQKLSEREAKWYEDLDFLSEKLKTLHPEPFLYVSEEEFDYRLEKLKDMVPELTDSDIFFEMQQIVAGLEDVHTRANAPEFVYSRVFPFDIISFGEKTYLYVYGEEYRELLDPFFLREIIAVNGVDMSYIRQKAGSLLYPGNSWHSKEYLPYILYLPAFFDWAGCDTKEGYTFHILNKDNQVELVDIPAVPYSPEAMIYNGYPEGYSFPRSFIDTDVNRAEYIEDERGGYVYLMFPYMQDGHMKAYEEFFDTAAALLKAHPGCRLVVDLRKNSGGDSNVQLFTRQRLLDWKALPIEKTYILTGGFMVSAAIDLITVFKEEMGGITVGEPTGQFPSAFGNSVTPRQVVYLPNSQTPVFIADMWWSGMRPDIYYAGNPGGRPYRWQNTVLPDVYVSLDAEDFRNGKDSVIEWVLSH